MLIKLLLVVLIILKLFSQNGAVTHWVVTETGRIQAYMESPYDMRRPYDLLALMEQEKRHEEISSLYNDLIVSKLIIEDKWSSLERTSNLGNKFTSSDPDCLAAGKLFLDIDLFSNIATNGSERNIKIPFNTKYDAIIKNHHPPDCSAHTRLYTGPWPYHEVPPLSADNGIMVAPDESLRHFMPIENIKLFGHEINQGLKKNSSSWLHYNMAAIYWRIKGDGPKAVACVQRAIHFVPIEFRDIPVHNLAGILHQSRHSKEAAMFLHSCVDHAPKEAIHHLALGNVYASLGDYNKSVHYYDQYLNLKPDQKDVIANRHAILCYWKLETGLIQLQESLQGILADLHTYHSQQQQWLRLQERLMWEHSSFEVQIEGFHNDAVETPSNGKKMQRCFQKTSASNKPYISCEDFYNSRPDLDSLNVESLFNYVKMEKRKLNDHIKYAKALKKNKTANEKKSVGRTPPLLHHKYPTTMSTATNQYYDATGWPTKDECLQWNLPVHQKEDLDLPVYLPPENKGYQIQKILGEFIDLPKGTQHDLPWHPPVCEHPDTDGDKYLPPSEKQALNIQLKSSPFLKSYLLNYVDDEISDEAEIGQRIITAMEKKSAPRWVLATLASLYWRVRGNARRALDCLDLAFQIVPKEPTDVVLVSIGSLVYQLGFNDQALKFATLAFKINYVEPSTNFLLALLHYSKHNPLLAMYYMKNVLRVEPDYYDGKAEELLKLWSCRVKLGGFTTTKFSTLPEQPVNGMCVKKDASFKGEGVLCSPNGEQCKTASIQCYPTNLGAEELKKPSCFSGNSHSSEKIGLGHTLISTLLSSDGGASGDVEPDQSKLESVTDEGDNKPPAHAFHMRLSLGEKHPAHEHARLGDFFVGVVVSVALSDDPERENLLHVYDQFGTYSLSPSGCKNMKITQEFKYTSVWPSIAARSLDITPFLRSSYEYVVSKLEPYCTEVIPGNMNTLDYLRSAAFKLQLGNAPDEDLAELLGLMASDRRASVEELGYKIAVALEDNEESWILAVAASVYWRVIGNSGEALSCLRVALTYVPDEMRDVPLNHMANLLNRVGYHSDALEIAHLALGIYNNFVLNHFTIANIHISMGELEKSVAFYRACLALDSNFSPARYKLQAVLCTLLFDEGSAPKPNKKIEQD
ncbi:unnamed protein product [Brassicogethes aeneus]|uniref:Tetratricopeptide repeat protein 17 n=1 Tax=Brassicogethes aeneus TaxID=1431903 RepID=A0A9P0BAE3_BRAAE|nr:unnamed protein product [Brassicogethes aeneus]